MNDLRPEMNDSKLVIPKRGNGKTAVFFLCRKMSDSIVWSYRRGLFPTTMNQVVMIPKVTSMNTRSIDSGQSIPTSSDPKLSAFRNSAIPSSLFLKHLLITDDIITTVEHNKWKESLRQTCDGVDTG